jgi:hypothetical protein
MIYRYASQCSKMILMMLSSHPLDAVDDVVLSFSHDAVDDVVLSFSHDAVEEYPSC